MNEKMKSLSTEIENIKNQMEILELKNTVTKSFKIMAWSLYSFPIAALRSYYKQSSLKQRKCSVLQFWVQKSEMNLIRWKSR